MGRAFFMALLVTGVIGILVLGSTSQAQAQAKHPDGPGLTNIEGGFGLGTEPCCGLGTSFGITFGGGFYHVNGIEIRADLSYFNWDEDNFDFRRIPLIFSGRYYIHPEGGNMRVYAQGGLGLSFDEVEFDKCNAAFGCSSSSDSETNLDLVPAAGVLFEVGPGFDLGAEAAVHITDESYFTLMFKGSFAIGN